MSNEFFRFCRFAIAILVGGIWLAGPAAAQGLPSRAQSVVLLHVIAERGLDCGLLRPWEAASIKAQAFEEVKRLDADMKTSVVAATAEKAEQTECDDGLMTTWIDGARKGLEAEGLSAYLVIYRKLALTENRPAVFDAVTLRLDYASAVMQIDEKLSALAASGAVPDGGKPWPDFIARTEKGVEQLMLSFKGTADKAPPVDLAASIFAQAALVTELWLQEGEAELK